MRNKHFGRDIALLLICAVVSAAFAFDPVTVPKTARSQATQTPASQPDAQTKIDRPTPEQNPAPAPPPDTKPADPSIEDKPPAKTQEPAQSDVGEKEAEAKAPKRFIPSTRTPADNSASFPVDI